MAFEPNKYSHTPRSVYERGIDRQDRRRKILAQEVQDQRQRIDAVEAFLDVAWPNWRNSLKQTGPLDP